MLYFVHHHLQFGKLQTSFLSAVIKDEITLNLLDNICTTCIHAEVDSRRKQYLYFVKLSYSHDQLYHHIPTDFEIRTWREKETTNKA